MINESKIIVNYLPQYHEIPENNKWWGKGFTDWIGVKNATPLYEGHIQPRVPLNNNYYRLDDVETIKWQTNLAKKYGIYGFGIYHYWFSSQQQLLTKPAELLLQHKEIKFNFMFIWDNLTWKRTWSKLSRGLDWSPNFDKENTDHNDNGILAELIYGNEKDWKKHYEYLRPFFKDQRYIKENNKPLFAIFQPRNDIKTIKKMTNYWNELAIKDGFDGILFLSKDSIWPERLELKMRYAPFAPNNIITFIKYKIKDYIAKKNKKISLYSYDDCWKNILKDAKRSKKDTFLCGFVSYDDTPRRGNKGRIVEGSTPQKFKRYFSELLEISKNQNKKYTFLMAWNEWGEGAYLEPDVLNKYAYLEVIDEIKKLS